MNCKKCDNPLCDTDRKCITEKKRPTWYVDYLEGKILGLTSLCKHDVMLQVSGNFESDEHLAEYCNELVKKLNA